MSKKLLQEYFQLCPDGICDLTVLNEDEKRRVDGGAVYLVGVIQRAGTKNGNGRIYRKETLQREVENYQRAVKERRSLGELDHPDDSVINLKNASHLVTKTWWDGDSVMGKIEVLDTPSGKVLKALLQSGVKLGISSRGLGSVRESGGITMVEDDFQLICFDIVSEPSTPGAYLNPEGNSRSRVSIGLAENQQNTTKSERINNVLDDILGD
jgi:hypothetical protein|tara:strand:- start:2415 stop:3047 length:633 start_codon:yes stop_codon:yes gene_type:complete